MHNTNPEMNMCNETSSTAAHMRVFVCVYNSVGLVGSLFLLVIIRRTPILKGITGLLLVTEQLTSFIQQTFILLAVTLSQRVHRLGTVLLFGALVAKNESLFLLTGICFNLFMAVCRCNSYKKHMTKPRCIIFIIVSWTISIAFGLVGLMGEEFVRVNCKDMLPVLTMQSIRILLVTASSIEGLGSLMLSVWFLYKSTLHRRSTISFITERIASDTRNKQQLTSFVHIISIMYSILFLASIVSFHLRGTGFTQDVTFIIPFVLSNTYINLKPCFYLPLYKPLWDTTKTLFRQLRRSRDVSSEASTVTTQNAETNNFEMTFFQRERRCTTEPQDGSEINSSNIRTNDSRFGALWDLPDVELPTIPSTVL